MQDVIIPFIWIGIIIFAAVVELSTLALVAVWFIPSAIISLFLSLFNVSVWIQVFIFTIISLILFILSKTVLKKVLKYKTTSTNVDALIGKSAMVTESIDSYNGSGAVKINGLEWSAKSTSNSGVIEKGQIIIITDIEGVTLICEPIQN